MNKTRKRILRQVAAGKISAEQGEKLLKELERDERSHDTSLSNFGSNVITPANIRNMIPKLEPAVNEEFLEAVKSGAYNGITWPEFKELVIEIL